MKLTYAQLATHLTKSIAPAYLISGDEPFLKNQAIAMVRKALRLANYTERERLSSADSSQLYTMLNTTSLLSAKKIIECDWQDTLPNKEMCLILEDYAKKPNADYVLLIFLSKVDTKVARANWFKTLEMIGIHVPLWPVTNDQLPQWIMERARKYKLTLTEEAARYLSELSAGNLTAAAQAIEKLYLLKSETIIDDQIIRQVAADEGRFNVFDLLEYIIAKDTSRALQVLHALQAEGVEPTIVLWGIARELRMLSEMAATKNNLDALCREYHIFPRRQANLKRYVNAISVTQCLDWLKKAAAIDAILKGSIAGNGWEALELLCLSMTT